MPHRGVATGIVADAMILNKFGVGKETDALFAAIAVPLVFTRILRSRLQMFWFLYFLLMSSNTIVKNLLLHWKFYRYYSTITFHFFSCWNCSI